MSTNRGKGSSEILYFYAFHISRIQRYQAFDLGYRSVSFKEWQWEDDMVGSRMQHDYLPDTYTFISLNHAHSFSWWFSVNYT